ncbi:hypothetical protein WN48_08957 [Eufriesea mexicana]|uniref:Uncharacterized protein n=1 Tax=Eufriesea mexicana TaxID=516756 RepID=A0A310SIY0_9HYME|nr:hypothetical protein WN48_08957 [Eufriesea mexicana]
MLYRFRFYVQEGVVGGVPRQPPVIGGVVKNGKVEKVEAGVGGLEVRDLRLTMVGDDLMDDLDSKATKLSPKMYSTGAMHRYVITVVLMEAMFQPHGYACRSSDHDTTKSTVQWNSDQHAFQSRTDETSDYNATRSTSAPGEDSLHFQSNNASTLKLTFVRSSILCKAKKRTKPISPMQVQPKKQSTSNKRSSTNMSCLYHHPRSSIPKSSDFLVIVGVHPGQIRGPTGITGH